MTSSNGSIFRVTGPLWGNPPVNSPHKGQWRRALIFSLIYVWTNVWANNRDAGDLRRHRAHYDVTVMQILYHTELKPHQNPLSVSASSFIQSVTVFFKYGTFLVVLCSKFENSSTVKMGVTSERDFVRFHLNLKYGRVFYITTVAGSVYSTNIRSAKRDAKVIPF